MSGKGVEAAIGKAHLTALLLVTLLPPADSLEKSAIVKSISRILRTVSLLVVVKLRTEIVSAYWLE